MADPRLAETLSCFASLPVAGELPTEIWAEIFLCCLPEKDAHRMETIHAPLLLCQVSRSWRQMATSTPLLWTRIFIKVHASTIDRRVALAQLYLIRSQPHPFVFTVNSIYMRYLDSLACIDKLWELVSRHASRWKVISFIAHPGLAASHIATLQRLLPGDASHLEDFKILMVDRYGTGGRAIPPHGDLLPGLSALANRAALSLRTLWLDFKWFTPLTAFPFSVNKLSRLKLHLGSVGLRDLCETLLGNCFQLQTLDLCVDEWLLSLYNGKVEMTRLKSLSLACHGRYQEFLNSFITTRLISFHLRSVDPRFQLTSEMVHIETQTFLLLVQANKRLRVLSLGTISMDELGFVACLRAAPSLKSLAVTPQFSAEPSPISVHLMTTLINSSSSVTEAAVPFLSELKLILYDQNAANLLIEAIESRFHLHPVHTSTAEGMVRISNVHIKFAYGIGLQHEDWDRLDKLKAEGLALDIMTNGPDEDDGEDGEGRYVL